MTIVAKDQTDILLSELLTAHLPGQVKILKQDLMGLTIMKEEN